MNKILLLLYNMCLKISGLFEKLRVRIEGKRLEILYKKDLKRKPITIDAEIADMSEANLFRINEYRYANPVKKGCGWMKGSFRRVDCEEESAND